MKKKSRAIGFRLNPRHELEERALEIVEQHERNGINPRKFLTDAILRSEGITPEMYKKNPVKTSNSTLDEETCSRIKNIENKINNLEGTIVDVLRDFLNHITSSEYTFEQPEKQSLIEQDGPTEYEIKIMEAIKQRQQQSRQQ